MSKAPSTSVFVGNIPYGLTEEQIIDIFNSAGKVLSFRLVYDRETGRPKGFGFAEYPDADSAASAVRNLNDYEIMNRKLRVDFSNDGGEDESAAPAGYQNTSGPSNGISSGSAQTSSSLPPLPAGVELPPGLTCPDAISRTLTILPPSQLLDVLSQMKQLVALDTSKAIELLRAAPQLSYAIFQALLLMGLVSTDALASVVEQHAAAAPIPAPPTVQAPTPQQQPQYQPPPSIPVHTQPQYPAGYPLPPLPPPPHLGTQIATPPVHGHIYPPPPPPVQQQYQPPPAVAPQPDTEALMQQVLAMPMSLIDQLPPAERAQILALRAQLGAQGR